MAGSVGLDLLELETFVAVAELGSFSLAAQHLHVSQPTVTGRVQRLESTLGTRLLVRSTRKTELSPQGALLLVEVVRALDGLRKITTRFKERARLGRRQVIVASTPVLASLTLPPIIRDYSLRFTDVEVVLRDLRHSEALLAVENGTADLAVVAFDDKDNRFRAQLLRTDEMVLVTPASHRLAGKVRVRVEELAGQSLLVIEHYEPMRMQIDEELKKRGLRLGASPTVANLNTLIGMLDAGMGPTLMPRSMASRSSAAGHSIVELEGIVLLRKFAVLSARKVKLGTAAESFIRFLRKAMT